MLETAISHAKAGDKQAARILMREILASKPDNAHTWHWPASYAEIPAERPQPLHRLQYLDQPQNNENDCA